ncbi:hypothetical protein Sru01_47620 [Sphaerisporangium rufum]|uniref:Uncharacterized protein n=1 Tax=Sphaerisporangium rufum TaxID=1381558 RepID=A0A919R7R7_9ACTN|nr:hypothetical protein [Sphaerisporangium rufum]GII79780.1 hypothetical protein Sru01_47620 [Sphaerisporangium rufum]
MNGWSSRISGTIAAGLLVAGTGTVLLPAAPATAESVVYGYQYRCEGGAHLNFPGATIEVRVEIPKSVKVGERIPLQWTLDRSPLASHDRYKAGGRLIATATVDVAGVWQGKLDSTGGKDQAELAKGGPLELPAAIAGSVGATAEGKLAITPRQLLLDFVPPADTVRVNDTDDPGEPRATGDHTHGPIQYRGKWFYSDKTQPDRAGDHQQDLHATETTGDTATVNFTGTKIAYIGERVSTVGKVEITVDGKDPVQVNAHDEAPHDRPKAQETLWTSKELAYGDHTVTVKNLGGPAPVMAVDAFDVSTGTLSYPPGYFHTTCTYSGIATSVIVDVLPAGTGNGDGGDDGGDDGDGGGGNGGQVGDGDGDDSARGIVVVQAPVRRVTPSPSPSRTPTRSPSSTPQVRVTPRGGAHTGEAVAATSPAPLLVGYGSLLALGGLAGALALRRRTGRPRPADDR